MKSLIMSVFRHPIIGRPTRKALWILLSLLRRMSVLVEHCYSQHPFVKTLTRQLDDNSNRQLDNLFAQSFDAKTIYKHYKFLQGNVDNFPTQPGVLLIVLARRDMLTADLDALVASINLQVYNHWELKVCREGETKVRDVLAGTNCEYFTVLETDCLLYPSALAEMMKASHYHKQPDVLYSDEIFEENKSVYHKPAWSPLLLYSKNYLGQMTLVKVKTCLEQSSEFDPMNFYGLLIALSGRDGLRVAHLPIVLVARKSEKGRVMNESALTHMVDALRHSSLLRGHGALASHDALTRTNSISFDLADEPLVSILIPTKNGFDFLKPCIDSIFKRSTYRNFEVIVMDHQSDDPNVIDFLAELQKNKPVKVVRYEGDFNFGRMNNLAAKGARGKYLVTLNNDTEVIAADWLERMMGWCQLPFVGAVGAKLLFTDQTIQHAGIFGCGYMAAAHAALSKSSDTAQYFGYFQCTHEVLGVTAACMMVERDKFWSVDGFDEIFVPNGWGDVDFCLKLKQKGLSNVYAPDATLYHKESKSRGRNVESFERHYLMHRYANELLEDPYHNLNLMPMEYKPYSLYSGHQVGPPVLRRVLASPKPTIELIAEYGYRKKNFE